MFFPAAGQLREHFDEILLDRGESWSQKAKRAVGTKC